MTTCKGGAGPSAGQHGHCGPRPSVVRQKFVEQIVAGTPQGAGPTAEAKEGVALGGAHLKMRDDDGPGPLTRASDV